MPLILILAVLGLLAAGPRGLILGAALGYALTWAFQRFVRTQLGSVQSEFLESTFAVMGALCKADSVVTRDEIRTVERIFDNLRLSAEQRQAAKADFNRGKAPDFDLDAEVDKFARIAQGPFLRLFLHLQFMAVAADGRLHAAEHAMLVRIARRLGLTERDVSQLEALLRAAGAGPSAPSESPARKLDDAYAALGVRPSAGVAEIKRTYRRLMNQNHPDKLAAKGLPESMRAVAEERTREINAAYDLIKDARSFV